MRNSYTNRKGEKIYVTKEHLDMAIKLKKELQKISPTRRTNWSHHKRMMEREGFADSDIHDGYRCLIKAEQKRRGILPEKEKHAAMIASSKLESIKAEIGEMNSAKLDLQQQGTEVRKLIRETNKELLWIEEIKNALANKDFVNPVFSQYKPDLGCKVKSMIVCLSDIHYGAFVDLPDNYYDTEVTKRCLNKYADKVITLIQKENVDKVYIMNVGDIVEHAYMRFQNLYNAEETLSEQVVNVTDLIIQFINKIAAYVPVSYSAIAGNHDRLQGNKDSNLNADHVVRISNRIIEVYAKMNKNVSFVESDDYVHFIKMRSFNFAFIHGDRQNLQKKTLLAELSNLYSIKINAVLGGHIHHFTMQEVGDNKYQVTFGSIKGIDEFSIKIGAKSCRSQGIVLVDDDDFEIKKINL